MNILVTGGSGFIGSHTCVELIDAGHTIVILDNFSNSDKSVVEKIETISGSHVQLVDADVRDSHALIDALKHSHIDAVIHFAALKAVGESLLKPLEYYENNVYGLITLLMAMRETGVSQLIFSSSATVYGNPDSLPITEDFPLKPATNPYGASKQMCEQIITDTCRSGALRAVMLRYFNPIGAHPSGLIGELPIGTPNNLVPYVAQTAAGIRSKLTIYGGDYDTPDGTGVRDFIHVVDLAKAHVKALDYLQNEDITVDAFNIGTGRGASVLELIRTFETVNDIKVPYEIGPRRDGDIASCYASASKAEEKLHWKAEIDLKTALKDTWRWQQNLQP